MANKRAYNLTEIPGDKTGYSVPLDKSGDAECGMVMYEDIITEAVTGATPVISSPTITEGTAITVTTIASKKAVTGKSNVIQAVVSLTLPTQPLNTFLILTGTVVGAIGQALPCTIISASTAYPCACVVTDDTPTTILNLTSPATLSGAVTVYINGTLITTS